MALYTIIDIDIFPTHYLGFIDPDDFYPYSGITDPDGAVRNYEDIHELVYHIEERRSQLGKTKLKNPYEMIQQYLYLVGEAPRSLFTNHNPRNRSIVSDVRTGANMALALSKAAVSGVVTSGDGGFVTKTKADARAKTCYNCVKCVIKPDISFSQRMANKIANVYTSKRVTPYDKELGDCDECGCPMYIKVHFSGEVIREVNDAADEPVSPEDFPSVPFRGQHDEQEIFHCWMPAVLKDEDEPI